MCLGWDGLGTVNAFRFLGLGCNGADLLRELWANLGGFPQHFRLSLDPGVFWELDNGVID